MKWLSDCELEVCKDALYIGATCNIFCQFPPPKWMIIVDLDANKEQEVVVEMEEHRISGVEEDEETSGVDELKDEGSSRLNYGKMSS